MLTRVLSLVLFTAFLGALAGCEPEAPAKKPDPYAVDLHAKPTLPRPGTSVGGAAPPATPPAPAPGKEGKSGSDSKGKPKPPGK